MAKPKVTLDLTIPEFKKLVDYLESHEDDIEQGINDFAELRGVFFAVFESEANEYDRPSLFDGD